MTAFDHFQEATCDIASGNRLAAIEHLDALAYGPAFAGLV